MSEGDKLLILAIGLIALNALLIALGAAWMADLLQVIPPSSR